MKKFRTVLSKLLVEHTVPIKQLAHDMNTTRTAVKRWLSHGCARIDTINKLAKYFKVPLHYLIYGEPDPYTRLNEEIDIPPGTNVENIPTLKQLRKAGSNGRVRIRTLTECSGKQEVLQAQNQRNQGARNTKFSHGREKVHNGAACGGTTAYPRP